MLVVVAIIALLIAILLPALSEARWVATRTRCATSVHGLVNAMHTYGAEWNDELPLGYHAIFGVGKQYNYVLCRAGNNNVSWINWGYLYQAEAIPDPRELYCPANTIPSLTYNYRGDEDFDNPWPPTTSASTAAATRVGYSARPVAKWDQMNGLAEPLPRGSRMESGAAIVSDVSSADAFVDNAHDRGVNVGYYDGSTDWTPREELEPTFALVDYQGFNDDYDPLFLDEDDDTCLWRRLDRD